MAATTGLIRRSILGTTQLGVAMGLCLFLPAWSWHFWQGWALLVVFLGCATLITVQLYRHDPALLERRLQSGPTAEQEPRQKLIQAIASLAFVACLVLPAFDHRLGWSPLPAGVSIASELVLAAGFWAIYRVFRENSFASSTIELADDQRVITTGPYALVRHPMYTGGLAIILAIPLALGSAVGLVATLPLAAVIVWRLLDEERFLREHLSGYEAYLHQTPYRLVPGVW